MVVDRRCARGPTSGPANGPAVGRTRRPPRGARLASPPAERSPPAEEDGPQAQPASQPTTPAAEEDVAPVAEGPAQADVAPAAEEDPWKQWEAGKSEVVAVASQDGQSWFQPDAEITKPGQPIDALGHRGLISWTPTSWSELATEQLRASRMEELNHYVNVIYSHTGEEGSAEGPQVVDCSAAELAPEGAQPRRATRHAAAAQSLAGDASTRPEHRHHVGSAAPPLAHLGRGDVLLMLRWLLAVRPHHSAMAALRCLSRV